MDLKSASASASVKNRAHTELFKGLLQMCLYASTLDDLLRDFDIKMSSTNPSTMSFSVQSKPVVPAQTKTIDLCGEDEEDDVSPLQALAGTDVDIPKPVSGLTHLLAMFHRPRDVTGSAPSLPMKRSAPAVKPAQAIIREKKGKKKGSKMNSKTFLGTAKPAAAPQVHKKPKRICVRSKHGELAQLDAFVQARDDKVNNSRLMIEKVKRVIGWVFIDCLSGYDFIHHREDLFSVVLETMVDSFYSCENLPFDLNEEKIDAVIKKHDIY